MRQSLDAEQGIQWIKAERLPSFLNSDCYLEYRLSKFLSQVATQYQSFVSILFLSPRAALVGREYNSQMQSFRYQQNE